MQLTNVTLSYGKKIVASNINATLLPGELVCLIGRNGSGKSTLIRYILKNPPLDINEKATLPEETKTNQPEETKASSPEEPQKLISVVLTDRIDIDNMTVYDVVAMGRAPYTGFFGILSKEDRKIVTEAMKMLSIEHLLDRNISTLSDGERQKVMIAKALAQQTPYILLDEPTAFLDYPSKVETMQLLLRLCKEQNKAIIISTHDLEIALRHCTKVWLMKNNTLTEQLPPKEIPEL